MLKSGKVNDDDIKNMQGNDDLSKAGKSWNGELT